MKPSRRGVLFAVALALGACGEEGDGEACLPPARADGQAEEYPIVIRGNEATLNWYCEEPPPAELLDGSYRTEFVWLDGESCDPCDREAIAAASIRQVCTHESAPPIRLLCGPIAHESEPWDRKGCLYAVGVSTTVICD